MEDVKHEQLLMLTFSRAAATEFKKRLLKLIGNAGNYIEIKTFHSYCFDLLGKVGSLEKSDVILKTRAKQNLTIHLNSNFHDNISVENFEQVEDREIYLPPNELAMHLTHKDVWLDYFKNKQSVISQLTSGDVLTLNGYECLNSKKQSVLKFSMQFVNQIESMKQRDYELKSAKVNFIIYWLKEGTEQEVKIILPELYFEKIQNRD